MSHFHQQAYPPPHYINSCILSGADHSHSVMLLIAVVLVPETYAPTLLRRKAKRLQREADERGTGEVFISKFDRVKKTKVEILKIGMSRPFAMLSSELIVFCLGLYGECLVRS